MCRVIVRWRLPTCEAEDAKSLDGDQKMPRAGPFRIHIFNSCVLHHRPDSTGIIILLPHNNVRHRRETESETEVTRRTIYHGSNGVSRGRGCCGGIHASSHCLHRDGRSVTFGVKHQLDIY